MLLAGWINLKIHFSLPLFQKENYNGNIVGNSTGNLLDILNSYE